MTTVQTKSKLQKAKTLVGDSLMLHKKTPKLSAVKLAKLMSNFVNLVPMPHISAQCWCIYDVAERNHSTVLTPISSKREEIKREVASLTKMMTFYTSL